MKRVDAKIFFNDYGYVATTVWVEDNATKYEIEQAILNDAMDMIEIEYYISEEE